MPTNNNFILCGVDSLGSCHVATCTLSNEAFVSRSGSILFPSPTRAQWRRGLDIMSCLVIYHRHLSQLPDLAMVIYHNHFRHLGQSPVLATVTADLPPAQKPRITVADEQSDFAALVVDHNQSSGCVSGCGLQQDLPCPPVYLPQSFKAF